MKLINMFCVLPLYNINMCYRIAISDCQTYYTEQLFDLSRVYHDSTQPQFPIYVCMLIHPQRWSTKRAIIWYWGWSVRQYEGEGKYSLYIKVSLLHSSVSSLLRVQIDRCILSRLSLRIAILPYLQCWIRRNTSRTSKTPVVNISVEFRESAVRVMEYYRRYTWRLYNRLLDNTCTVNGTQNGFDTIVNCFAQSIGGFSVRWDVWQ